MSEDPMRSNGPVACRDRRSSTRPRRDSKSQNMYDLEAKHLNKMSSSHLNNRRPVSPWNDGLSISLLVVANYASTKPSFRPSGLMTHESFQKSQENLKMGKEILSLGSTWKSNEPNDDGLQPFNEKDEDIELAYVPSWGGPDHPSIRRTL